MKKIELLAPAGGMKKLNTALHFGADAVYLAGKKFGLRAYADNFDNDELSAAALLCQSSGKKMYVTLNIFAKNADFGELKEYLEVLERVKADAVIVSDPGMVSFIKKHSRLPLHLSTQANTTNKYSAEFWKDFGVERIVLARELCLDEIKEISDHLGGSIELEAFIHGAMCISYSGRCLLSSYLTDRDSNRGECVQACRWEYNISEVSRPNKLLPMVEDEKGTYIMNSMDMCTMPFLERLIDAGITSMKIEGRMKSEYYVGTVVNAYRKRLDGILRGERYDKSLYDELYKAGHREYTDGFYLGKEAKTCLKTSKPLSSYDFMAEVRGYDEEKGCAIVEQRNRFKKGEELEILSSDAALHNRSFVVDEVFDEYGTLITDCKRVQQILYVKTEYKPQVYDMLRKRRTE